VGHLITGQSIEPDAMPETAGWFGTLLTITAFQAVLSLLVRTLPLFGLPLTLAAGMPPEAVGQFAAATSAGSMMFFLWGPPLLTGVGAMTQLRLGCLIAGVGLLACLAPSWPLMLLGAFVIGLGYGPSTSAASEVLMRRMPPIRRATSFSVKQAGVPLGGAIAGAILPVAALAFHSVQAALVVAVGVALLSALFLPHREGPILPITSPLGKAQAFWAPLQVLGTIFKMPRLRRVAGAGLGLGAAQGVLLGYFAVYLSTSVGWSVAQAGLAFAALQAVGMPGRILIGYLSDRIGNPEQALGWLALASTFTMLALATFGPSSPTWWIWTIAGLAGLTVISWNSVFILGLAEAAPNGEVAAYTGAGTFVLFCGYVLSPLAAQLVYMVGGSYAAVFSVTALAPALVALLTLQRQRSPRQPRSS